MASQAPSRDTPLSTREALASAGLQRFAENGYGGSRLTDIAADADVTTGAFYGHFSSKVELFELLFERYGGELQSMLDDCVTLEAQFEGYIEVSRRHRGVVRASAELLQRNPQHAAERRRLRDNCAGVLAWRLREPLTIKRARVASRLLVDVLEQYAFMEAAELIAPKRPSEIAQALFVLIESGLYIPDRDS
ncbi:MAG TPA: TetR family transcriptional regulator [Solirubrobacteraceae bacterium]|jgi:AcrR family transcriptional regulator